MTFLCASLFQGFGDQIMPSVSEDLAYIMDNCEQATDINRKDGLKFGKIWTPIL
jgi:hypothetical protein